MIEVKEQWLTTPMVCAICEHKVQLVVNVMTIQDGEDISFKLPPDGEVHCPKCGSDKIIYTDYPV